MICRAPRPFRLAQLVLAAAIALLAATRPAQAQSVGFNSPEFIALSVGVSVASVAYVVGGTATFAVLDIGHLSRGKPFSPALRWLQVGYGVSLVGVGAVLAQANAHPGAIAPFLLVGTAFPTVALLEWNGQRHRRGARAQVSVGGAGVSVRGSF